MLSPRELELLTGQVDGELTPQQRRQVEALLKKSPEARALLRQLEEDARQLRQLSLLQVPRDLSASVVAAVGKPVPERRPTLRLPRTPVEPRIPTWLALTAAAVILFAVGAFSFFFHSDDPTGDAANRLAQSNPEGKKNRPRDARDNALTRTGADKDSEELPAPVTTPDQGSEEQVTPQQERPIRTTPPKDVPTKSRAPETVLASGGSEAFSKLERIDPLLPSVWKLHELGRGESSAKLVDELQTSSAFRVELLAKDATRGFERLRTALLARGVQLHFDPLVQPRLKKPLWRTDFALFLENVTPADLVAILKATGTADRQAGEKKGGEMRFDGPLVVKDLSRLDRKELADLLGVDPVEARPSQHGGPGMMAYVSMLAAGRNRPAELKRYLDARKAAEPGTIQVFLVVRHLGS